MSNGVYAQGEAGDNRDRLTLQTHDELLAHLTSIGTVFASPHDGEQFVALYRQGAFVTELFGRFGDLKE